MSDYLSPGVYIQELEAPSPIAGVSTSITAFVGLAERGPVNVPILCTGPGDYTRWFGGLLDQDTFQDINDLNRYHCYLPYAVSGYFTNSGQLLYVTRVVPSGAQYATEQLYDRIGVTPTTSTLVRSAAQGDGGPGDNPLIMLAPAPDAGTFPAALRIGDGSASEYALVESAAVAEDAFAVDLPLQNYHLAGVNNIAVYPRSALAGTYTLTNDAAAGSYVLLVQTATGTLTLAQLQAAVFEIATYDSAAIVIPASVAQTNTASFTITLTNPLVADVSALPGAVLITPLSTPTAPTLFTLDYAAAGGDVIVYTTAAAPGDLIDLDYNNTTSPNAREIRTIASSVASPNQLTTLAFSQPNTIDWPAGTVFSPVAAAANEITAIVSSTATATVLTLTSITGIMPGSVLLLGTSPAQEFVTVTAVNTIPSPPQVTVNAPPSAEVAVNSPVALVSTTTLAAPSTAASQQLVLVSRAGINAGSVLRIGASAPQEYAVVLSVPGIRALGADPGPVVLETPLANSYASGAGAALVTFAPVPAVTAPPAALRATPLVLDMPAGAASGYVTWSGGWPTTATPYVQVLQVTLADGTICYTSLSNPPGTEKLNAVSLSDKLQGAHPAGSTVVSRSPLIGIQALDMGLWGNRLFIAVQDESPGLVANAAVNPSPAGGTQLSMATLTGIQPGSYLEMYYTASNALVDLNNTPIKVASVNTATGVITLDFKLSNPQLSAVGALTGLNAPQIYLRSREFRITVYLQQQPSAAVPARNSQIIQTEVFRNLSMDPRHNQYFDTIIGDINGPKRLSDNRPEGSSWLIRTQDLRPAANQQLPQLGPEALIDILPNGLQRPARHNLTGGYDGVPSVTDYTYIGADSDNPSGRSGIYALLNVPQISIVAVPGQGTPLIQSALISHCENALYRFAILDPQYPTSAIADIQTQRQQFDTKFAAIYYPWLTIPDPFPVNLSNTPDFALPPSGHVAGIFARVDNSRGVFKAPANEVVQGITGLTVTLAKGDQDILNPTPTNINVIRDFRQAGRGIRVWGSRIMTSDANYTYVPVKRLLMFIEESLDLGLQDIVFEPNAPPLWASVERLIGNFLTTVWAAGGLQGDTADDSFFVRCDLTTMTQTDIDAGRLIAQVGVAPVYPAEFVIIQISLTIPATSN